MDFVAEPGPDASTDPSGGYFLLQAAPGDVVTQSIGLRNDTDGPVELVLAAVDAVTGQRGGASYGVGTDTPVLTGAWVTLDATTVTLAPEGSSIVPFHVAVPADAQPGQHLAGISILAPETEDGSDEAGRGQAGASIDVQTRRVIAVQVDVPGPAEPDLVIGGVTSVARADGLYLEISIENTGRKLTKAVGVIKATDFERTFDVDTFVPGTSIGYPVRWASEAPEGDYPVTVELRYGDDTATFEGTFTVGEQVIEELADRQIDAPPPRPQDEGSDLPVAALAGAAVVGAVVVGGAGFALARIRRPARSR